MRLLLLFTTIIFFTGCVKITKVEKIEAKESHDEMKTQKKSSYAKGSFPARFEVIE